ncbi:MAG TPA: DUF5701 family protein [Kiritimatiellia bacterium]|nr:DUF5701 family protein [Kiritimatiellia bacterium]
MGKRTATAAATAALEEQVDTLVRLGYPAAAGLSERAFRKRLAGLAAQAGELALKPVDYARGRLPFVVVVKNELVPTAAAMALTVRAGKSGYVAMQPVGPDDFTPLADLPIPDGPAYLLVDIDRGADTLNVRPEDALRRIRKRRRSPLTIEEGVALVAQHPDFLQKNNCFSLPGSRRADQRVPAIWIDGARRPKLGWCWDRNPHTWLGSASCKHRLGA